jgi:hypothetical protein
MDFAEGCLQTRNMDLGNMCLVANRFPSARIFAFSEDARDWK